MVPYNVVNEYEKIVLDNFLGDRLAYKEESKAITYEELFQNVSGVSHYLTKNLEYQDRIILDLPDSIDFVISFLAALKAGIIPVIINNFVSHEELQHIIKESSPKLIVTTNPKKYNIFNIPILNSIPQQHTPTKQNQTTENTDAFWLCSSGTTGKPKLIVHKQKSIIETGKQFAKILNLTKNDVVFSAAKMSHAYGLGNSISIPLTVGASVILLKDLPTSTKIDEALTKNNVNVFCGVPRHYASLLMLKETNYNLKRCLSAGENLPDSLFVKWKHKFGMKIVNAVGSTEFLGFMLYNNSRNKLIPLEGIAVKISKTGELLVKSESMSVKDHKNNSLTIDGYLPTNDIYEKENNTFKYLGRVNDVVKVNGVYISLLEIETKFKLIPGVEEVRIKQTKNKHKLNKIEIELALSPTIKSDYIKCQIKELAKKESLTFRRPYTIHYVEQIPKTSNGKVKRN
jgi:acyl-coenzyme A synthetase/AMP-(fatty) acid ligase